MKSVCTFALCVKSISYVMEYGLVNVGLTYPCGLKQDISFASVLSSTFSHMHRDRRRTSFHTMRNTGGGKRLC